MSCKNKAVFSNNIDYSSSFGIIIIFLKYYGHLGKFIIFKVFTVGIALLINVVIVSMESIKVFFKGIFL